MLFPRASLRNHRGLSCLQFWTSAAKPKYFLGFWFWLDLISTASLLLDIPALQVRKRMMSFIAAWK